MQIHGLNKTTLLDYPGLVASTVFTGACNFRCPFCQNGDLVLNPASIPTFSAEEVFAHVDKRKGIIQGVCITGGEPTLQKDLKDFIKELKKREVKVKLDTNGYCPNVLKDLILTGLVDYVAMDIKSGPSEYHIAAGTAVNMELIRESIDILMSSKIDYEFRTTVVRELHNIQTFLEIGELIKGAKQYFLQGYVDSERVIAPGFSSYSAEELEMFKKELEKNIKFVSIRGVS